VVEYRYAVVINNVTKTTVCHEGLGEIEVGIKAKTTIKAIARARTTITSKALTLGLDHIQRLPTLRNFFFTPAVHEK
jgi:hypothetical protein